MEHRSVTVEIPYPAGMYAANTVKMKHLSLVQKFSDQCVSGPD
jgi:hypothetical protein